LPDNVPCIGDILDLEIETVAPNGKGKGRAVNPGHEKLSFFVNFTAPGDRVTARVTAINKRYIEAELVELTAASALHVDPPCPHFRTCGGCHLMHLNYAAQMAAKTETLRYILGRRGFDRALVGVMTGSPLQLRYRRRSKVTLIPRVGAGMQIRSSHDVTPIGSCRQMTDLLEDGLLTAAKFFAMHSSGSSPSRGQLCGVVSQGTGQVFIGRSGGKFSGDGGGGWFEIKGREPVPTGNPTCTYQTHGFTFLHPANSFTQVNHEVNELLIDAVLAALQPQSDSQVLELFAGVGNFTLPIAKSANRVTAVEWRRTSMIAAENAKAAHLSNIVHLGMGVIPALEQLKQRRAEFDLVLLDPPREGVGEIGCNLLATLAAKRIVYVSCDPSSLIRDLVVLRRAGYQAVKAAPFDMFPQTFHVEACVTLER